MTVPDPKTKAEMINRRITQIAWIVIALLAVFVLIMAVQSQPTPVGPVVQGNAAVADTDTAALSAQINPKNGYNLSVSYGDLGPQLLASGVIDYAAFASIYQNAGSPLTADQIEALKNGSDQEIVINAQNAYYLLNFFWAVGLANQNTILTEGPMVQNSDGKFENFASTGGWSLATKPITELYASLDLIPLTEEQQKLVEEVAQGVYRPCCDNPTHFPDCNHGMAMLGILELMASQGATADQMFEAAKYVNAYWFPQQTLEAAVYLKANQGVDFAEADPRLVVGRSMSSASGSKIVHADLQSKGLLQQAPGQGGSCAN
jgi:hypothetical protein